MKYILQFLVILGFTFMGEVLSYVIPFPIPAAIYGLVLLLIALCTGLLKLSHPRLCADFGVLGCDLQKPHRHHYHHGGLHLPGVCGQFPGHPVAHEAKGGKIQWLRSFRIFPSSPWF